jgi:NAD-dependent SIR2 family protein deacetylase
MEHNCQKLKKMRMRKGLQVLDPEKMGLQVLDPAQGCNGQVRPRVVLHGNENDECSNSAFFQRKNRKSVLAVCAIRLKGQTDRVIRTVRITIQTLTVAISQ